LTRQAKARGIAAVSGETAIERLLVLEAALGAPPRASRRADDLAARFIARDATQWSRMRGEMAGEFHERDGEEAMRVRDFFDRWHRRRHDEAMRFLSSNYSTIYVPTLEWERRFHDFVAENPRDAVTWGWLFQRRDGACVKRQYGRVDGELAYRFYLEFSGLGDGREARRLFSVPGTAFVESR
jgi:hypothetical protein